MTPAQKLMAAAQTAVDEHRLRDALQLCDRAALLSPAGRYDAARLRGDILLLLGDARGALSSYESVADVSVPDPTLDCARGQALFLLGRLAEAENALRSSLGGPVELALAHHTLGLIAETLGTGEHVAHYRRARQLAPERFPPRARLTAEQFRAAVDEAVLGLPEPMRAIIGEIPVLVAELPSASDLGQYGPRLSPLALAMVVGVLEPNGEPIDSVEQVELGLLLYRRNFERQLAANQSLVELIRETIYEELRESVAGDEPMRPEVVGAHEPRNDDNEV